MNGWWTSNSGEKAYAFMPVDIIISKFEYTSIVEVDPVDGWAIIGSIGGVWREYFVFPRASRISSNCKSTNICDAGGAVPRLHASELLSRCRIQHKIIQQ